MNIPSWQKIDDFESIIVAKRDRPLVKFVLMFDFGAQTDPQDKQGLTNITGDMLLRGCKTLNRTQIEDKLDELGASLNVFTGYHSVSIEGRVLKRYFPALLQIVSQALSEPLFDKKEFQDLIDENVAQIRTRLDDDQGLAKVGFNRALYQGHTYANEVTGTQETLQNITVDDVKKHFDTYYSTDQVKIGLCGDVSNAMLDICIMTLMKSLPKKKVKPAQSSQLTPIKGKKLVFIDKPDRSQTHFFIGHQTQPMTHPNAYDYLLYHTAFCGGLFQAKYMQEIRVKRGWAYGAVGANDYRKWANAFYLYTFPKNEDTAEAITTSLDLYQQAKEGTIVNKEDIEFAKHYLYKSFPFKIDTPDKILSQKIHHKILGLPEDYIETYRHHIESVEPDGIANRIQSHFSDGDFVISVLGTKDKLLEELKEKIKPDEVQVVSYESFL